MKKEFCTMLNSLKSPQNVGMIVRTHVAYGGSELIVTGQDLPCDLRKGLSFFQGSSKRFATFNIYQIQKKL